MFDLSAAISNKLKENTENQPNIGKNIQEKLNAKNKPKLNIDKNPKNPKTVVNKMHNNIINKIQSKLFKNTLKDNSNTIQGNILNNGVTSLIIFCIIIKFF